MYFLWLPAIPPHSTDMRDVGVLWALLITRGIRFRVSWPAVNQGTKNSENLLSCVVGDDRLRLPTGVSTEFIRENQHYCKVISTSAAHPPYPRPWIRRSRLIPPTCEPARGTKAGVLSNHSLASGVSTMVLSFHISRDRPSCLPVPLFWHVSARTSLWLEWSIRASASFFFQLGSVVKGSL
ncbi:hypothetical protein VTN02DRAFT_3748 [Thermoascus thermophilus]